MQHGNTPRLLDGIQRDQGIAGSPAAAGVVLGRWSSSRQLPRSRAHPPAGRRGTTIEGPSGRAILAILPARMVLASAVSIEVMHRVASEDGVSDVRAAALAALLASRSGRCPWDHRCAASQAETSRTPSASPMPSSAWRASSAS
jgi:hypothetical protein